MTARKKPALPYVLPMVGRICNSTTKGGYSTQGDASFQALRTGADTALACPSRYGDRLHYRDGTVTDMASNRIAKSGAKHRTACKGNQIFIK